MDKKELIKLAALLFLYGFAAPVLSLLLKNHARCQKCVFGLLCFMTTGGIFGPSEWGLTLSYFEYRGHERGYHFYFADVLALSLILARALEDWKSFRLLPPGLWVYLAYCGLSFLSIVNAPEPRYVLMATFKFVKMSLFFVASYNFLLSPERLRFFLLAMCVTMGWQLVVVLKIKYLTGIFQVPGTFDHQNCLSMFTTMIAMVLLGAALAPKHSRSNWYFVAFLACAVIQQSTFSRAGLVIFVAGTVAVAFFSVLDRWTWRRFSIVCILALAGVVGLFMAMDSIKDRFRDSINEASGQTRQLLNTASEHMLQDYPLGIGWNNFALVINKPYPYGDIIDEWEREGGARPDEHHQKGVVESHYWLLLAETGYQGFIFYLLFILLHLWRNARAAWTYRSHFVGSVSLGIFFGCACNYLHSLVERILTQPRNMMLWMLLLGATARIETWRRARSRMPKRQTQTYPEREAVAQVA